MDYNIVEFGTEARAKMIKGVNTVAKAVSATLGPKGRNVVLQRRNGTPHITKDGVSVASAFVALKDPFENMGAQLVKEVAKKTADVVGDATTTSTVLTEAIITQGSKLVAVGHDPMSLKRGIDKATEAVVAELRARSTDVKDNDQVKQIARISANGDEVIGQLIADAIAAVGKDGSITIEEGKTPNTELKIASGFEFDRGYLHPAFINDQEHQRVVYENALVWLVNAQLSTNTQVGQMMDVLGHCAKNGLPIILIAESVEGEVLATFVLNAMRQSIKGCVIKAPGFGESRKEMLQDLAVLTGANLRDTSAGESALFEVSQNDPQLAQKIEAELGIAKRIVVSKEATVIVGPDGREEAIEAQIKRVRASMRQDASTWDRERTEKRLAKLTGGVCVIKVGGSTEVEVKEKRDRVEDALCAVRSAVRGGFLPGGGAALVKAARALKGFELANPDELAGAKVIFDAIRKPLEKIVANAGLNGEMYAEKVYDQDDYNVGYDAAKLEMVNMIDAGIIDPTEVVCAALSNASSIAGLMLTTEAIVCVETDKAPQQHPGQQYMM